MNKNSFMTKFLVLLLLAGIATLVAPMAVQAVPRLSTVEIIDMHPAARSGNSLYAFARQRLVGDWAVPANRANLIDAQSSTLLVEPGYSLKDSLGEGQAVKFFRVGDEIKFKVTFDRAVIVHGTPALRLSFDGARPTNDPRAVYDAAETTAAGDNKVVIFTYTVRAGDDCFGDGIGFPTGPAPNMPGVGNNPAYPLFWDVSNRIQEDGAPDTYNPGGTSQDNITIFQNKINEFYSNIRYLIDTRSISANVRITGIIKPATHTGDLRTAAVDFSTGGFTSTNPNVDVTEGDDVTGPFDVEFLFFNYGTGTDDKDVIADTTQGFEAADIKITGLGVDSDATGWTVSPVLIGLDHRDPGFPGETRTPGQVTHEAAFKVYKATITPPSIYDGDVMITVPAGATMDIAGNGNLASNTLRVSIISVGVPVKDTLTLPSVALPAKGFVVLAHEDASVSNTGLAKRFHTIANLPNLETLFTGNGGTLELIDKRDGTKTLGPIITEIMWGTDLSKSPSRYSQWIEIYNAGADIADLSVYSLKVTPFSPDTFSADDKAVDTVGNLGNGRWDVPGQGGRTVAGTGTAAAPIVPLISMRRKVDFNKAANEVNNGTLSSSWEASTTPALDIAPNRIATPGKKHTTQITQASRTNINYSRVIINEIGNSSNSDNVWIELRNVSTGEQNLKNWQLSIILGENDEKVVMKFPDKDIKLGAGKVLLLVNKDPLNTPLARGKKFGDYANGMTAVADQEKSGLQTDARFYDAKGGIQNLPGADGDKFLLVLRSGQDKNNTHEKIVDISGELYIENEAKKTNIWPLIATPSGNSNAFDGDLAHNRVYKRNKAGEGFGEKVWVPVGYTGLGYDRSAGNTDANGGTPGFPNDAVKEKPGDLAGGAVTISEIMVVSDGGRYPQWIELRNSSATRGVKLDAWRLRIENESRDDVDSRQNVTIDLPNDNYIIGPNQTILIATRRGSAPQPINSHRVILLWNDSGGARQSLEVDNSRFSMLSMKGFTLKLFGQGVALSDTPTDEVTIGAEMLTEAKIGTPEERISLIRYYDGGVATDNWGSAKGSEQLIQIPSDTYYGISDDIGTPGYYPGTALPVSLSSFLPKRTDAGVVIKWTTQSELNNAGFNILRSATKTGAFVVINPTMIQGAGTTGEKHTYSYTDKTAKPNIVYYYQIEDVSFDGHRQRLTGATRLRGHIGAAGKLTTTWGDLKVQE